MGSTMATFSSTFIPLPKIRVSFPWPTGDFGHGGKYLVQQARGTTGEGDFQDLLLAHPVPLPPELL